MFADAYEIATKFTRPLVISFRRFDGQVESVVAGFVVINRDGWVVTAAHVFDLASQADAHRLERTRHEKEAEAIVADESLDGKRRRKKLQRLHPKNDWITNYSYWWSGHESSMSNVQLLGAADLAVFQLENFDSSSVSQYPVFRKSDQLRPGTGLCRLGYPFHKIEATFDEDANRFDLAPGALPLPMFPNEGIYTRNHKLDVTETSYPVMFIETSSPGLPGQSGGPIFDAQGRVWSIQSRTHHLDLGFDATIARDGKQFVERQVMNLGVGPHPQTLAGFLYEVGVEFESG